MGQVGRFVALAIGVFPFVLNFPNLLVDIILKLNYFLNMTLFLINIAYGDINNYCYFMRKLVRQRKEMIKKD